MNLPTLPTDNLYKFMALSGLAIAVFSVFLPLTRMSEIRLNMLEIETQLEVLEIEVKYQENNIIDALVNKGNLSPKEKALFRNHLIDLLNKDTMLKEFDEQSEPIFNPEEQASFRSRSIEIRKKIAEVKGRHRQSVALLYELKSYRWILWIGGMLGLVISFFGFGFWYYLIQRPNDMLLRKHIRNHKT